MNERLREWFKRDFWYILALLLALTSNLMVLSWHQNQVNDLNAAWINEIKKVGCWDRFQAGQYSNVRIIKIPIEPKSLVNVSYNLTIPSDLPNGNYTIDKDGFMRTD